MSKIERFDRNRSNDNPGYRKHWSPASGRNVQPRHTGRTRFGLGWVWILVALSGVGLYAADRFQMGDRLMLAATAPKADTLRASFPFCADGRRTTCIVDGDTLWLSGAKIRIADIDAPELSPPRCETERVKGEAAKRRLRDLMNAGPFSLVAGLRDEDQYGRKLRTVTRDGRSIGDLLVQEGLARRWDGSRHPWCG